MLLPLSLHKSNVQNPLAFVVIETHIFVSGLECTDNKAISLGMWIRGQCKVQTKYSLKKREHFIEKENR